MSLSNLVHGTLLALAVVAPACADPAPGPLSGARLAQVTLPASDLDRSVAFYRDVLGVAFLFRVEGAAFFDVSGIRLRLERSSAGVAAGPTQLYFEDPELSHAKALEARGVRFNGPAETVQRGAKADLKILDFTDPDGNALALIGNVSRR